MKSIKYLIVVLILGTTIAFANPLIGNTISTDFFSGDGSNLTNLSTPAINNSLFGSQKYANDTFVNKTAWQGNLDWGNVTFATIQALLNSTNGINQSISGFATNTALLNATSGINTSISSLQNTDIDLQNGINKANGSIANVQNGLDKTNLTDFTQNASITGGQTFANQTFITNTALINQSVFDNATFTNKTDWQGLANWMNQTFWGAFSNKSEQQGKDDWQNASINGGQIFTNTSLSPLNDVTSFINLTNRRQDMTQWVYYNGSNLTVGWSFEGSMTRKSTNGTFIGCSLDSQYAGLLNVSVHRLNNDVPDDTNIIGFCYRASNLKVTWNAWNGTNSSYYWGDRFNYKIEAASNVSGFTLTLDGQLT